MTSWFCHYRYLLVKLLTSMTVAGFSMPLKDIPTSLKLHHSGNTDDGSIDGVICKWSLCIDNSGFFAHYTNANSVHTITCLWEAICYLWINVCMLECVCCVLMCMLYRGGYTCVCVRATCVCIMCTMCVCVCVYYVYVLTIHVWGPDGTLTCTSEVLPQENLLVVTLSIGVVHYCPNGL